ncbi:MAG: hypothetical protein ACLTM7_03465 [Streptococcus sp.]
MAETTRALTQYQQNKFKRGFEWLVFSDFGNNSNKHTGSIDIFHAAGKTVTQAARKIAESIADLDTIGKQTLAAARVVLFLLVLYLAEITFI